MVLSGRPILLVWLSIVIMAPVFLFALAIIAGVLRYWLLAVGNAQRERLHAWLAHVRSWSARPKLTTVETVHRSADERVPRISYVSIGPAVGPASSG